jgi:hypothetical protein
MDTLTRYIKLANHPEQLGVVLSCDDSDMTMSRNLVHEEIDRILKKTAYHKIFTGPNTSKIEACNANMSEIDWEWDIVVLVSDDMIPQVQGYDDVIRNHMLARFPDTDGILWFNDGYQGEKLNTLTIMGRKMYDRFGYLYHPDYKSLFCDTEFTDLCKGELKDKCLYVPYSIIRHEHPGTGFAQNMDALYDRNQKYWDEDMHTYIRRKKYPYDWSVLIPTMPGRETGLQKLMDSIREKVNRICPSLRYEICLAFDNKELSIGAKRQLLLDKASGKYLSFIDDDDDITDEYIQDINECIAGGFHTMRLHGFMKGYDFVHSLDVKLTDMMATQDNPPIFQRPPNHLNPMLSDAAKFVPFKNAVHGEDLDWTISLFKAGFLKTQYKSDDSRVHYIYNLGERTVHPDSISLQQRTSYESMLSMIFTPSGVAVTTPSQPKQPALKLGPRGFVSK